MRYYQEGILYCNIFPLKFSDIITDVEFFYPFHLVL